MNELITENKLIASFLLIVLAVGIRWLVVRHLRKLPNDEDDLPRRWMNGARNAVTTLVVIGLIIIWLSELRFVALSIATFTVALIIATREFIQCFLGALYQTSTRAFSIGDWIKVGSNYGEVVSSDWLTTKLLEIDMESMSYGYTGKTLVIPNNQFVANPIQNLNFMRRYVAHSFIIVRDAEPINVFQAKELILEKAQNYSASHNDVAQRYNEMLEKRLGVTLPGPESSVRVTTTNLGKNQFTITVFCPTEEAVKIEQKLTEDFMAFWYAEVEKLKVEKEEKKASKSNIDGTE
jgi:small-conductance mechanosensitive channel